LSTNHAGTPGFTAAGFSKFSIDNQLGFAWNLRGAFLEVLLND
jgi:hypothetical protein